MTERTKQATQQSQALDYNQLAMAITQANLAQRHEQHETRRRPSPLHYVTIAIAICQLIGLLWVGLGKMGTLITDQRDTNKTVSDTARQVQEIKSQVADIKSQQDTDRKNVDAKLETFQYDIRDILVALAAKQIFTPNDNTRLGGMPATRDDNPSSNANRHRGEIRP